MAVLQFQAGDVIPIPARVGEIRGYVLSRVLMRAQITVIEVFGTFHHDLRLDVDALLASNFASSERLFAPVMAAFDFNKHFGKIKWPIIGCVGDPSRELALDWPIGAVRTSHACPHPSMDGGHAARELGGRTGAVQVADRRSRRVLAPQQQTCAETPLK
jgi:hypothetical protein